MKIIILCLSALLSFKSFSQQFLEMSRQLPREKIHLNVNKAYYLAGEKLNLEVTLADARTLQIDTLSVPLYVELIDNKKDSLIGRWILKITDSKINTTIKIPDNLESNYYQFRAYTDWMRNFSTEAFSQMNLLIFSKNYKDHIPKEVEKSVLTKLNVHPESGICVNGLVNNLYVQTTDNYEKGIKSIVALKSDTTTIRLFDTDEKGEALVEFEPVNGKNYYLESGSLKTSIVKPKDEGVILRGYYADEVRKLTIIVQNNLKNKEPIKLVLQIRGNIFYNTLIEPTKFTVLNFKIDSLPEGILNAALFDLEGNLISQRAFLNAHKDRDNRQNYLLFNSELNAPIESTDKLSSEIRKVNMEMINKRNVIYGFDELQRIEKLGNNFLVYKNELGISVTGKVLEKMGKDLVNVSLIINPEQKDTLYKKQLFVTLTDKNGNFSFENLDFYGQSELNVQASIGKKVFKVAVQKDSIPSIIAKNTLIDWREFIQPSKLEVLKKEASLAFENRALEERLKVKELEEVTVTSKKEPKSPLTIFKGDPSVRFLPNRLNLSGAASTFKDFYRYFVFYRHTKYLSPVVKFYVDDFLMTEDQVGEIPNNLIAYVDVHDGTSDSNMIGASILLNIYTKGYFINPMVRKITGKGGDSLMMKVQRNGYYVAN